MHSVCRYIDDELMDMERKIQQGGKLSMSELEYGDKLAHFKKCLLTNKAMEESGYSEAGNRGGYSRDGRSYGVMYDGTSYGDMSYARRRDSMGRYSRDGFMDKLMDLRNSAPDEKHRTVVDRMMAELEH